VSISILLLEDDSLFGESLVDLLEDEGFKVTYVLNGQDALDVTYKSKFDLYLLDINVPILNGMELLQELRCVNDDTPAIFLTSHKDKEYLEKAFLSGCDDYMVKPLDNDELIWRISALLKRSSLMVFDKIELLLHDSIHQTIMYDGEILELSKKEYKLLLLFMQHFDALVPKELILDTLWSSSDGGSDGAIRVHINRIRQLLPKMKIENIRGIGYRLVS